MFFWPKPCSVPGIQIISCYGITFNAAAVHTSKFGRWPLDVTIPVIPL
jgi:hypothetical protein